MKLPSMQMDLKAVPQQPEFNRNHYKAPGGSERLTKTSEESKESEYHEWDDNEEKVESILWVFHLVKIGLYILP